MVELRKVRIRDFGRVVTGKTPPSSKPELFGEQYPFLTPTDIDGAARYIDPDRFLSPAGHDYQQQLLLPPRATCVVCIGATIGKVCMTDRPSFTNQQINSVVVNEEEHDPFFIYHLLTTLRDELKANAGGAATPIINKTAFSEIEVSVPPLPVQRRIAGILSAYDELIENSQRRIKILEAMARALYRSDEFRGVAIKSMSGATGRQRVQEQCFNDFQIVQPPRDLLDRLSTIVAPSFRLIHRLYLQIQNLRCTRDLLLPRLLSGQTEVEEA